VKLAIARLTARETDARKDWCEKVSTGLARRFDTIRVEDLKIAGMTLSARGTLAEPGRNVRQKAGLNREISRSGWGLLVLRLGQKAPDGCRKSVPRTRASAARRAGTWTGSRARAKRGSGARPAASPATRT
jgi:putative transposase